MIFEGAGGGKGLGIDQREGKERKQTFSQVGEKGDS